MTRRLVLSVDALPDAGLTKNARRAAGAGHWSIQQKAIKAERERAGWLLKAAGATEDTTRFSCVCGHVHPARPACTWDACVCKRFRVAPVSVTFGVCFGDRRHRDLDGWAASTSVWMDALVDLGVLAGDDTRYVRRVSYAVLEGKLGMRITIEEAS